MRDQSGRMTGYPGVLLVHVGIKNSQNVPHPTRENRILQAHPQLIFGNVLQNSYGIVVQILPSARREFLKNFLGFLVPGPPQIFGEPLQPCQQVKVFTRLN